MTNPRHLSDPYVVQHCLLQTEQETSKSFSFFNHLTKATETHIHECNSHTEGKSITLGISRIFYLDACALDHYNDCLAVIGGCIKSGGCDLEDFAEL